MDRNRSKVVSYLMRSNPHDVSTTINAVAGARLGFLRTTFDFVGLIILGVPIWASIGVAAAALLIWSGALPLSLLGESLFDGIDHFALTAVPLFILTGDVLVRTGLSKKVFGCSGGTDLLDVEGLDQLRFWYAGCSAQSRGQMRPVPQQLANDDCSFGGIGLSKAICMRFSSQWRLYRYIDPSIYCLHCDRTCTRYLREHPVPGGAHSWSPDPVVHLGHQYRGQSNLELREF